MQTHTINQNLPNAGQGLDSQFSQFRRTFCKNIT